jgi:hypothetical protein
MKTNYYHRKIACYFMLLTSMPMIFVKNADAQLNLSQTSRDLDFFPVIAGNYVIWETSSAILHDGNKTILYNGAGKTQFPYYVPPSFFAGSGNYLAYHTLIGKLFLFDGKNHQKLSDEYHYGLPPFISGNKVFWPDSTATDIHYYNGSSSTSLGLYPGDTSKKTMLSVNEKTITYQGSMGNYYQLKYNGTLPYIPTKLNVNKKPGQYRSEGNYAVWVEYDGNDQEIFLSDGISVKKLTDNITDDYYPVVSGSGNAAWLSSTAGGYEVFYSALSQSPIQVTNNNYHENNLCLPGGIPMWQAGASLESTELYTGSSPESIERLTFNNFEEKHILVSGNYASWSVGENDSLYAYTKGAPPFVVAKKIPGSYETDYASQNGSRIVWSTGYSPSEIYLFDFTQGLSPYYSLGSVEHNASCDVDKFYIPFMAKDSIANGLIGLDFTIHYDATMIQPTNKAVLGNLGSKFGAYALNTAIPGKVIVSVYLSGAPQGTYLKAKGSLINIQFKKKTGTGLLNTYLSTGLIEESFVNNAVKTYVAEPGYVVQSANPSFQLLFWNYKDRPMGWNGAQAPNTEIGFCNQQNKIYIQPDSIGRFNISSFVAEIKRDIPGDGYTSPSACTDVMSVINAADRNATLAIATYANTHPSIFELVAADVNQDGKVTSGDAALISSRTINGNYCEFPQKNNYVWNGTTYVPAASYKKSRDWVFYGFHPSGSYPASRDKVPLSDGCVDLYYFLVSPYSTCNQAISGILLGDVVPSWKPADGKKLRTAETQDNAYLDLEHMQVKGNQYLIPLKIETSDTVTGLDFSVEYTGVKILGVEKNKNLTDLGFQYNDIEGKKLMVTSYDINGVSTDEAILYIKVEADQLDQSTFENLQVFINGIAAGNEPPVVTSLQNTTASNGTLVISPNPSTGLFSVTAADMAGEVKIEITDLTGQVLKTYLQTVPKNAGLEKQIDLSHLPTGSYFVKMSSDQKVLVKKIVKI